ncbi:MAG: HAMP domain-containing protein [Gammaproteobacteria bacterium]|nr:HAMP domain-containing protein [Gammaproteobacteria bacterium]
MRLTIATRIFLALTLVSLVILTLNAVVTRWNFERGFLEYVAEQEAETISDAAAELAALYRREGNWDSLRGNPRRWNDLLRGSGDHSLPEKGPGPGQRPGRPPPPHDPLELGRRISLTDANGAMIIGMPPSRDATQSVAVIVDGTTVGFVLIAPRRQLTNQVDQNFAREQERSIYLIAVAALLFAALISAVLARQLTRPIRSLASGARSVAAGHYDTRIPAVRDDELGDLARDFNRLAETLEKNRASRQQWVADIAHELRTPLAVLRGELDAIEDGIRVFDTATQRSLQAEIARLTKLVGQLHDLSVYDEGGLNDQRDRVDIGDLLATVLENAEHRLQDANIALTKKLPERTVEVIADASRFEQLFSNLIENTIRYTDAPGSLYVTCAVGPNAVDIEFADSTPGVPGHALGRLFDRLFRVDASRSRRTGGSGLGLSICKAIVDAHGGSIEALDSDAGGLLIRIHLPLADATRTES